METPEIIEARTPADFSEARVLFEEYAAAIGVEVCLQNFTVELDGLRAMYGPPRGVLLLLRVAGASAGSVGLRPFDDAACEMKRLWVRPAARGKQLGRRLTAAVIERARAMGYRRMLLDTHSSMHAARSLYVSLGFCQIAPYYADPRPDIACYELPLDGRSSW
jgi:ribosomal protein S18 acetylase RimI-like enzyme